MIGSPHWAGTKFGKSDGESYAYFVLIGAYGRSKKVKLNRLVNGFPKIINPSTNHTISFFAPDLGRIERMSVSMVSATAISDDSFDSW